jgi:hypothetical protein
VREAARKGRLYSAGDRAHGPRTPPSSIESPRWRHGLCRLVPGSPLNPAGHTGEPQVPSRRSVRRGHCATGLSGRGHTQPLRSGTGEPPLATTAGVRRGERRASHHALTVGIRRSNRCIANGETVGTCITGGIRFFRRWRYARRRGQGNTAPTQSSDRTSARRPPSHCSWGSDTGRCREREMSSTVLCLRGQ